MFAIGVTVGRDVRYKRYPCKTYCVTIIASRHLNLCRTLCPTPSLWLTTSQHSPSLFVLMQATSSEKPSSHNVSTRILSRLKVHDVTNLSPFVQPFYPNANSVDENGAGHAYQRNNFQEARICDALPERKLFNYGFQKKGCSFFILCLLSSSLLVKILTIFIRWDLCKALSIVPSSILAGSPIHLLICAHVGRMWVTCDQKMNRQLSKLAFFVPRAFVAFTKIIDWLKLYGRRCSTSCLHSIF